MSEKEPPEGGLGEDPFSYGPELTRRLEQQREQQRVEQEKRSAAEKKAKKDRT